ncbi:adenosylcobinamide-phosphate synthase CbiB [Virgibacillus profundi]
MEYHLIAIFIAVLIDFIIGDPPAWPHPVKWIGSGISLLEKLLNKGISRKSKGLIMVFLIISVVFLVSFSLVWLCYLIHPVLGIAAEAIIISTAIAQKGLKQAALEVYQPLKNGNMVDARLKLSYIVGRDTENLNKEEVVRGTVETVAENISDGVTAPLFWGLIGGAPIAIVYRAINTCDSMVGYKNEKFQDFGWAAARLDDLVNWIPSRLTAIMIMSGHKPACMSRKQGFRILFRDAKRHPSPNSGWLEAAIASLLGVQLGGVNYYKGIISNRQTMGEPILRLNEEHIIKTNSILTRTTILFLLFISMGGLLYELAGTWF